MKNQARVAEIFNRAEAYQINASRNDSHKKSVSWQKPWVRCLAGFLVVVLLFGTGVGLFLGLKDRNNGIKNFDKMFIANFANYKAIGAGSTDTTAEQILQPQGLQPAAASSNSKHYLVGVDKDNHVERCKASRNKHSKDDNKKDDDTYEIDYEIRNIYAFTRYTFVEFGEYYNGSIYDFMFNCENSYVIDNQTGKFYSLDIFDYKWSSLYLGANSYKYEYFSYDEVESDDSVFVTIHGGRTNNDLERSIYKVSVKGEELEVKEVFNYNNSNLGVKNYFVDRFNNLYLMDNSYEYYDSNRIHDVSYILTSNGKIVKPADIGVDAELKFFRSVNGICYAVASERDYYNGGYYYDYPKYIGADGQAHDNDFDGCGYFFEKAEKVKTMGNVEYYIHDKRRSEYEPHDYALYKVTWEDDVKFAVDKIEFTPAVTVKDFVATKDYTYIIEEKKVSKIEIETGKVELFDSGKYIFTSIQADYLGNVIFNGIDEDMNQIVGIIINDGVPTILTKPREYQIYYIAPVN